MRARHYGAALALAVLLILGGCGLNGGTTPTETLSAARENTPESAVPARTEEEETATAETGEEETMFYIQIGDTTLTAAPADTEAADALKAAAATQLSIREGGAIDLVIEGGEGRELLVLPFAYEDGGRWTAQRNGEEVPVEPVFEGMMGVRLEEGENSIQLRYHHPGAGVGAAVSAVSAVAAAVWFAAEKRRAKGGKAE